MEKVFQGYIGDDYTITDNGNLNANDYNNAIQDRSQSLKGDAYITNITAFVDSDVPNRIFIAIYDADRKLASTLASRFYPNWHF